MTAFDLVIRGGTVATASDTFRADVGIRDGRIAALGDHLGNGTETIDAGGKLVLPGGIDSHVHFAQPSGRTSSWRTISKVARVRRCSAAIRW